MCAIGEAKRILTQGMDTNPWKEQKHSFLLTMIEFIECTHLKFITVEPFINNKKAVSRQISGFGTKDIFQGFSQCQTAITNSRFYRIPGWSGNCKEISQNFQAMRMFMRQFPTITDSRPAREQWNFRHVKGAVIYLTPSTASH